MPTKQGVVRVLSVDGGGVRGLLALEVIKYLEALSSKPVSEMFDIITGTSTGGLIALGLAKDNGYSAAALSSVYQYYCPKIFARTTAQKLKSFAKLAGPKYSNAALYECAVSILGGKASMADVEAKAMVTTYDINGRTPKLYSSWQTPGVLMVDAAMSTTAAPTYFPPWHDNVDGGVCNNNPALSAVIEACRIYDCTVRDVEVLTVGTGSDTKAYDGNDAKGWGLLTWAEPVVNIAMDGSSMLNQYHLQRLLPDAAVTRIQCNVAGDMAALDNANDDNMRKLMAAGANLAYQNGDALKALVGRLMA